MPNVPVPAGGTGVSAIAYDMNYTYDQLGNRFTKIDAAADPDIVTTYHYDTDDLYDRDDDGTSDALPYSYQTRNNRLQYYEVRQGEPPASTLIEKCWYAYNRGGQVKRIVQQFPQSAHPTWYYERVFQYNIGQQLWLARGYHREDESCPEPLDETDYVVPDWIIEYRYDGDRGRYLTRRRDPETRGRLTREHGSVPAGGTGLSAIAYDMNYTYDQLGNRFTKTDAAADPDVVTTYHYDTDDLYDRDDDGTSDALPYTYLTRNNRLQYYETKQDTDVLENYWYAYNAGGQAKRIVQQFPWSDPDVYYSRVMQYNLAQQLWLVRGYILDCDVDCDGTCEECCPDPLPNTEYVVPEWVIEYRYDGDRGRYLVRPRDPNTWEPKSTYLDDDSYDHWTEYVNDLVHRDVLVDKGDGGVETLKRYVHGGIPTGGGGLGYGLVAQYGISGSDTRFFHGDLVGTTRLMTDSSGAIQSRLRWTAFGEPLPLVVGEPPYGYEQPSGAATRYGYAGSWGYQNDGMADGTLDIGLLHVGARYYDPAIGRFVMRDPIGIWGGVNVYGYCRGAPTIANDATGRSAIIGTLIGFVQQYKTQIKYTVLVVVVGSALITTCEHIQDLASMPNLRDDELYGGEDGTPVTTEETQAGGKSCDQMEQVQHDVEGATKTPGTIFKIPAKPGRP